MQTDAKCWPGSGQRRVGIMVTFLRHARRPPRMAPGNFAPDTKEKGGQRSPVTTNPVQHSRSHNHTLPQHSRQARAPPEAKWCWRAERADATRAGRNKTRSSVILPVHNSIHGAFPVSMVPLRERHTAREDGSIAKVKGSLLVIDVDDNFQGHRPFETGERARVSADDARSPFASRVESDSGWWPLFGLALFRSLPLVGPHAKD